MSGPASEHLNVDQLAEGDVVRILVEQHLQIRELCVAMSIAMSTEQKSKAFAEIRELVAVHEAAEEAVLRPTTLVTAGEAVVDLRHAEEKAIADALAELERLTVDRPEFDARFADFAMAFAAHAEAEEVEEFARLLETRDDRARSRLGTHLLQAETLAPVHSHPALAGSSFRQRWLGPFASLLDHAKDLFARSRR